MITAGLDIGSVATKAVLLEKDKFVSRAIALTGAHPEQAAEKALKEALEILNLQSTDVRYIVSTGYGRRSISFGDQIVTEISAAAKGINYLKSGIRTVIDLGGQDSKVIALDKEGKVMDFVMNDRCAAGTGRFLETMTHALGVPLDRMGDLSLESRTPIKISSICTVFAESEVISLIAQGKNKEDIIAGVHGAIAERICGMLSKVGTREDLAFIGGGAKNMGVKKAIEDRLKMKIYTPEEPQFVIALGAALMAKA